MEIQREQFSAGEIAQALRIDGNLLQNWLRRSNLEQPPTIGGRRLFSAESAVQLAILKELNHYGMGPVQAGELVTLFMAETKCFPFEKWCRAEGMAGDEFLVIGAKGNSGEDVGRAGYTWRVGRNGGSIDLGGEYSGLILGIGAIVQSVYRALKSILTQRAGDNRAV